MSLDFDRRKSLQELENNDEGVPRRKDTPLVAECRRLNRVPLQELTPGDCVTLLGQNIGAPFLVPMALEWLQANPMFTAHFYNGDLLNSVLGLKPEFWKENHDLWWEVKELLTEVECIRDGLQYIAANETTFIQAQPDN